MFFAGFFKIMGEEVFEGDRGDEYNNSGGRIIRGFGLPDFGDGFSDNVNTGYYDDNGDGNGGEALDSVAVIGEFLMAG